MKVGASYLFLESRVPNWDDVIVAGRTPNRYPMNTAATTTPSSLPTAHTILSSHVDDMSDISLS